MATETRKFNTGAIYGSLAYDVGNPALHPDYAEEAQWRVQHQTNENAVQEELTEAKAAAVNMQALSPVSVIGVAFAALMIVIMLLAQARLTAVCSEAVHLTSEIEDLEMEQRRLQIAFESAFNLNEVEQYAVKELGMQKPGSDQIFCIQSTAHDKVEIFRPEDNDGLLDRLGDFAGSFKGYLG